MDGSSLLRRLNSWEALPTEALLAARANRDAMIPVFIGAFEESVSSGRHLTDPALFFGFHLLGEWRAKCAYPVLARFLQLPDDVLEPILGDAKTATTHRVMAAVFDGDPQPLQEIIYEQSADEFVRSRMIDALAILTMRGELSRMWSAQFLRECYDRIKPQKDCYVWCGWQQSIAWLGLADQKPLVEQAFARGSIDKTWLSFEDFEKDLQHAIDHPDAGPRVPGGELTPLDDAIAELSKWSGFQPEDRRKERQRLSLNDPERNPFRKVGRNDPCPCGSGKKFKKCCLNADMAE